MKLILLFLLLPLYCFASKEYAIELSNDVDPQAFAVEHNLKYLHSHPTLSGIHLFSGLIDSDTKKRFSSDRVLFVQEQKERKQYTRKLVTGRYGDPLFHSQWHLPMVGAPDAWDAGKDGRGIVVAIVDDGLQHEHPDLKANYAPEHSFDFNYNDGDPNPSSYDGHGTSAAGVAAAVQNNNHCGSGVAPKAKVAGIRLIARATNDYTESLGLGYHQGGIRIYSCSWGPRDDAGDLSGPGRLTQAVLAHNPYSIYVWASGNGAQANDNCNYDGYANNPNTFAIGAINHRKHLAYYSEGCAALMAVAPSSGGGREITTTDLMGHSGYSRGECTSNFGGTSSAAPLAAGIIALVVQGNPRFTRRDVQHIIARGATPVVTDDPDWHMNGRNYRHSHKYGFGNLVLPKLLDVASKHTLVAAEKCTPFKRVNGRGNLPTTIAVDVRNSGITFVETVQLQVFVRHPHRGEVAISLQSPEGTTSQLALVHPDRNKNYPANGWTFTSVRHWGEAQADGRWIVSANALKGSCEWVALQICGM